MSPSPVKVSPLIRLSRWSLLVAGIVYGAANKRRLAKKEQQLRLMDAEQKVARDAQLAAEKKRQAEIEAQALALLSGIPHD